MKCPSCRIPLVNYYIGSTELNGCRDGCGGVWFDKDEIYEFDEQKEFPASEILELAEQRKKAERPGDTISRTIGVVKHCPRCTQETLGRQFIDVDREIEIDQCWNCGGIWFDAGEINLLRHQYADYEDRSKAVNLYVDTKLAEVQEEMKEEGKAELDRYNDETKNRLTAFLYGFKQLLGLDDPGDSL